MRLIRGRYYYLKYLIIFASIIKGSNAIGQTFSVGIKSIGAINVISNFHTTTEKSFNRLGYGFGIILQSSFSEKISVSLEPDFQQGKLSIISYYRNFYTPDFHHNFQIEAFNLPLYINSRLISGEFLDLHASLGVGIRRVNASSEVFLNSNYIASGVLAENQLSRSIHLRTIFQKRLNERLKIAFIPEYFFQVYSTYYYRETDYRYRLNQYNFSLTFLYEI